MNRRSNKDLLVILFWILICVNILWFGSRAIQYYCGAPDSTVQTDEVAHEIDESEGFYYSQLSEENKKAYDIVLEGLRSRKSEITIESCSSEELEKIFYGVIKDHPSVFWTDNFRYQMLGSECKILPNYVYTTAEIQNRQEVIDGVVQEFFKGISTRDTDYNKILYTYEYVINKTSYDLNAENNQHIDSALIGNKTVCAGYAKTMKYLLNHLGIDCMYVEGTALDENGEEAPHAWNIVVCESEYYYVDATWGDPIVNGQQDATYINYDYLCFDDVQLSASHRLNDGYTYPSCVSNTWNYYVVNNILFDMYDKEVLDKQLKRDLDENRTISEFKFANKNAYEQAKNDIHNDVISKYSLPYSFYSNDNTNKITVYWK